MSGLINKTIFTVSSVSAFVVLCGLEGGAINCLQALPGVLLGVLSAYQFTKTSWCCHGDL